MKVTSAEAYYALVLYLQESIKSIIKSKKTKSILGDEFHLQQIRDKKMMTIAIINLGRADLYEEDEQKFRNRLLADKKFHRQMESMEKRTIEIFETFKKMSAEVG